MSRHTIIAIFLVTILLAAGTESSLQAQVQTTIPASKDNTIYEESDSLSNGAGRHMFVGRTKDGHIRRALLHFPIADSLPPGAVIQSVALVLYMSKTTAGAETISIHRVLSAWGEGNSAAPGEEGSGALADSGDATWLYRLFATVLWARAGGFYSFQQSAALLVAAIGIYTWGSTPEMVTDVQEWLDDPENNHGWILVGNEEGTRTAKRFDTKEQFDQLLHPALLVTYILPTDAPQQSATIPSQFHLAQNYPNPFNAATVIDYSLPPSADGARVMLDIFNTLGQRVRTLVNSARPAGQNNARWDGRDDSGRMVGSGIYVYRITATDLSRSKKLLFIR